MAEAVIFRSSGYLDVEAKSDHRCPNVFVAKLNGELVGHVLKVIQQWTLKILKNIYTVKFTDLRGENLIHVKVRLVFPFYSIKTILF